MTTTDPGVELTRAAVSMVLGIALPLGLQLLDRRRLDRQARTRGWNFATWGSALYAFGPLSLLGWSWVTRRRWLRGLIGPAAAAVVLATIGTVDAIVQLLVAGRYQDDPADLGLAAVLVFGGGVALLGLMELGVSAIAWWRRRML